MTYQNCVGSMSNAVAWLIRHESMSFHTAFDQVFCTSNLMECEREKAKRDVASNLGIRSGIARRQRMVRTSSNIRPVAKRVAEQSSAVQKSLEFVSSTRYGQLTNKEYPD